MNCEACRIGRYQPATLSYLCQMASQMIIIPNAPAYVCDVCKQTHFDPYFVEAIDFLLARLVPQEMAKPAVRQQPVSSLSQADLLVV